MDATAVLGKLNYLNMAAQSQKAVLNNLECAAKDAKIKDIGDGAVEVTWVDIHIYR